LGDLAERLSPGVTTFVLVRHRYIDDRLAQALAGGHIRQVVLLGAGYDTRAYRFATALAGRPVFEVDFPATSNRKARILARHARELPPVDVRRVEIDFQTQSLEERLLASGFAKGSPTFFVWEGVSMYLRRQAVKGTLRAIAALGGPGSEVAMDFWYLVDAPDLVSTAYRASASALSLVGEPVTFGIHPEDCVAFLEREGFRVDEVADAATLEERYVADRRRMHPAMYLVHAVVAGQ
ncbi:MAG: class I SAM-dependent methyltransferase, partial [Candidatus Rokuibacteriota bacterium]